MNRKINKLSALFITTAMLFLVGFENADLINLGNAINRNMNAKSFTMDTTIGVSGYQMDKSEVKINIKADTTNPDRPVVLADMNGTIMQLPLGTQFYMETAKDVSSNKYIIKLPANIGLPANMGTKYLQFTGKEMLGLGGMNVPANVVDAEKEKAVLDLEKKIGELALKYYQADTTTYNNVELVPNISITNPEGTVQTTKYTLSINDDTMKKAIKYYLGAASKDDNFYSVMNDIIALSGQAALKDDFKTQYTSLAQEIINSMDDPNFEILGSKGAAVSFYVNDSGYVVKFEGTLDLVFDSTKKQEYNISITSDIYNIDKTTVQKPAISSGNSIKLTDFMKQLGVAADLPTPILNKKIYAKENIVSYKGNEYINIKDVTANKSVSVKYVKGSQYTIRYNNKLINTTAYKVSTTKYVNHRKQTTTNIYIPSKALNGLGLSIINFNIITKEKPLIKNNVRYINTKDIKRNTSINVKVNKNSKYIIGFNGKSATLTPVKVTKYVYVNHKKTAVSNIFLSEKALKDMGLYTKNI